MPSKIAETDSQYQLDWSKWPVPRMPALTSEPWGGFGSFWSRSVLNGKVDAARTAMLPVWDVPVTAAAGNKPWQGSSYGMPFNLINAKGPTTPVWDMSKAVTWNWFTPSFPITQVPLPATVRLEGDPNGGSDLHFYGLDQPNKVLVEMIVVTKSPFNRLKTFGQCDWTMGYGGGGTGIARWDLSKPWDAPGQPRGVVAAMTPQFPMFPRWEEIRAGRINHAVFGVLSNYSPEFTGSARASDGDWNGHPVRAGERLRLKQDVLDEFNPRTPAGIVAQALREFGWFQGDRCGVRGVDPRTVGGGFALTQDIRWREGDDVMPPLGPFELHLSDFEVVTI